jgi:anaerobic magnesium-protoporphyrin IX monomethyl ester cyclase
MRKTFFGYPWIRDKWKRKYMMGCLKAFAKTTWEKKFYDLERLKFKGMSSEWELGFDESKVLNKEQIAALKKSRPDLEADINFKGVTPAAISACGPPNALQYQEEPACRSSSDVISACGAPNDLVYEEPDDADAKTADGGTGKVPDKAVAAPPR